MPGPGVVSEADGISKANIVDVKLLYLPFVLPSLNTHRSFFLTAYVCFQLQRHPFASVF